jgi:hypothetical protein
MLDYLDQVNKNPKPFVWTADAGLILGKSREVRPLYTSLGQWRALTANFGNSGSGLQIPRDEVHQYGRCRPFLGNPPTSCERRIALPAALAWLIPATTRSLSSSRSNLAARPR